MRIGDYAGFVARMRPAASIRSVTPLVGGSSATIVRIDIEGASPARFVVRTHGERDLARNPTIATDEYRLLEELSRVGLPVPRPLFLDPAQAAGEIAALAIEWVDGNPRFDGLDDRAIDELAASLAAIHRASIEATTFARHKPRPPIDPLPEHPDESIWETRSRQYLAANPPNARNRGRVLHGDYWLGNILWSAGHIVAVIDWEDFGFGDPLVDLSSARLELLWALGERSMNAFTDAYFRANPIDASDLAYWDIAATLHFSHTLQAIAADAADLERKTRSTQDFLASAYQRIR